MFPVIVLGDLQTCLLKSSPTRPTDLLPSDFTDYPLPGQASSQHQHQAPLENSCGVWTSAGRRAAARR